jgi:hypothetical protein
MNDVAVQPEKASPQVREVRTLASKLATAFRHRVERYKHQLGLAPQEAVAKAEGPCTLSETLRILHCPPDELTWEDVQGLVGKTGERAANRWEEVRQAAREAVRSGDWAAAVGEGKDSRPWLRALFLALREELGDGWQPRNGVERQLLDQMAQAQTASYFWQERLALLNGSIDASGAAELAEMVDRFNGMFVRLLRALRDLRRFAPTVVVQNAGQVNVGSQQVNVAG